MTTDGARTILRGQSVDELLYILYPPSLWGIPKAKAVAVILAGMVKDRVLELNTKEATNATNG